MSIQLMTTEMTMHGNVRTSTPSFSTFSFTTSIFTFSINLKKNLSDTGEDTLKEQKKIKEQKETE